MARLDKVRTGDKLYSIIFGWVHAKIWNDSQNEIRLIDKESHDRMCVNRDGKQHNDDANPTVYYSPQDLIDYIRMTEHGKMDQEPDLFSMMEAI